MKRMALAVVAVGAFTWVGRACKPAPSGAEPVAATDLAAIRAWPDSAVVPIHVSFRYAVPEARVARLLAGASTRVRGVGVEMVGIGFEVAIPDDRGSPASALPYARKRVNAVLDSVREQARPGCGHARVSPLSTEPSAPQAVAADTPPLQAVKRSQELLASGGAFIRHLDTSVSAGGVTRLLRDPAVRSVRPAVSRDGDERSRVAVTNALRGSCAAPTRGSG